MSGMGSVWDSGLEEDEAAQEVEVRRGGLGTWEERVGKVRHFRWTETGCRGTEWGDRPVGFSVLSRVMQASRAMALLCVGDFSYSTRTLCGVAAQKYALQFRFILKN